MTKKPRRIITDERTDRSWVRLGTIARSLAGKLVAAREEFLAQQAQGVSAGPGDGADTCPTVIADHDAGEDARGFRNVKFVPSPAGRGPAGLVLVWDAH